MRKLNILIGLMLVSTLFFGFMSFPVKSVLLTGTNFRIDWDEYNIGVSSGSGNYHNWYRSDGDDFVIVNDYVNTSSRALWLDVSGDDSADDGYIFINQQSVNATFNRTVFYMSVRMNNNHKPQETSIIMFSIYSGATVVLRWRFRNYFNDASGNLIEYYDSLGSWNTLDDNIYPGPEMYDYILEIEHVSGNTVDYNFYTGAWVLLATVQDSCVTVADYDGNFTKIYIDSYTSSYGVDYDRIEVLLDDMLFYFPYQPPYVPPTYDVSMWDYIGTLHTSDFLTRLAVDDFVFEDAFMIPTSLEIKAVDLRVSANLYLQNPDLSDYFLNVGFNYAESPFYYSPVAFIPFQNYYLLRWYWLNITVDNAPIVLEFISTEQANGFFWNGIGVTATDNDGDGDVALLEHGDGYLVNGKIDGWNYNRDICYRIYYEGESYIPPINYTDYIGIKDNPPYYTNTNLFISYTIATKEYENYMEIWKNGERMGSDQGFGTDGANGKSLNSLEGYSSTVGFVAFESGTYSVNIRRNGVNVTRYSFVVLDNPNNNYYLYTIPNPSVKPKAFTVYYKYYHAEGKEGIICIDDVQTLDDDTDIYTVYLFANTTGNFSYSTYHNYNVLYLTMGVEISAGVYTMASFLGNPHLHYISGYGVGNYINLEYSIIDLNVSNKQIVTGHHEHLGSDIYILDNGEFVIVLSDDDNFRHSYTVSYAGLHKVDLVLNTANGSQILDTKYYTVGSGIYEEPDTDAIDNALGIYKLYLGIGVIVLFIFIPVGISAKTGIFIPDIVYIASALTGASFSVASNLVEPYFLVLIVVGCVAIAAIKIWGK